VVNPLDRLVKNLGSSLIRAGRKLKADSRAIFLFEDYHILDLLPDSLFIKNSKAEFLFGNASVAKLMGVKDPKLLYGKTDFDFYPKQLAEKYFQDDMVVINSGKRISVEEVVIDQTTKESKWFYSTKAPLKVGDDGIVYLLGIGRDISERKKMVLELESERRINFDIVEHMPEEIMVVDKNGAIVKVNKAKRHSGDRLPKAGDGMYTQYGSRHNPELNMRERLMKCIKEGNGFDLKELRYPYDDPHGKFLDIKVSNIPGGAIIISRDVSEEKVNREEAIKAQKLESLGLLAGGIAHDFNNLFAGMFGHIDLANIYLKEKNIDHAIEALGEVNKTRNRATGLSGKLLTFAKGGVPVKEPVQLSELISENVGFALSGSNVQPLYSLQEGLAFVDADKVQISQVIDNIVINAKQSMPRGGDLHVSAKNVSITKKPHNQLMLGDYVKLSIRDEGCGIPNEDLQKIFDPYFTTKEGGNGLGLATCYSIIKNHGGYISVNSKVGKGSTFSIFLPASKACALEDVVSFEGLKQGSGRILVMDAEPSIRKVLSDLLLGIGYNVECASNGCEAIEMYKAAKASDKPFDVAIMDLTIPGGMGGADAIKKLHEYDPEVKAIVCSGYCDDPIIANPNSYGFKAGIVKPVNFEELSKLVEGLIKK